MTMSYPTAEQTATAFDLHKFWQDVEKFRRKQAWTKTLLADSIGMDRTHLATCIRDHALPSVWTVYRLATVCDLDLNTYSRSSWT